MNDNADPPPSESLFCDALVSAVTGDHFKAVLELGVAAEVAITHLLGDVANNPPTNQAKRKFIAAGGDWDKFKDKLESWPGKLGLQNVKSYCQQGMSKNWHVEVNELYRYRGAVAHGGRLKLSKDIAVYVYATNALLAYCREQRQRVGLPVYSYPSGVSPFEQLEAVTDAVLSSESPPALGPIK